MAIYGSDCNHPDIAGCYCNIGSVYSELREYESALESHKKSLAMMKAVYGPDTNHHYIADFYCDLGNTYSSLGEYPSALMHYIKGLEIIIIMLCMGQILTMQLLLTATVIFVIYTKLKVFVDLVFVKIVFEEFI